tara:strand:+ start:1206 stop:1544 length:339 start_codon:yes stop_codon:yes gene_type:complete
MTLRQKQSCFAYHVGRLLLKAYSMGYEITLGEASRPKITAEYYAKMGIGIPNSLHISRLAIDLNLFIEGKYQRGSKGHDKLGEWWKKQHELARWGGDFGDPNHYSFAHNGKA